MTANNIQPLTEQQAAQCRDAIANAKKAKQKKQTVWENMQLLVLGLTILGQVTVGAFYLAGQGAWCVANFIAVIRDFVLHRPIADKIKDSAMLAITIGLIAAYLLGAF